MRHGDGPVELPTGRATASDRGGLPAPGIFRVGHAGASRELPGAEPIAATPSLLHPTMLPSAVGVPESTGVSLVLRSTLPVGSLFYVFRRRPPAAGRARRLGSACMCRKLLAAAGLRRRFAPHQLRRQRQHTADWPRGCESPGPADRFPGRDARRRRAGRAERRPARARRSRAETQWPSFRPAQVA